MHGDHCVPTSRYLQWLGILLLIGAASQAALADGDDLRGGVLITHAPPGMEFSTEEPVEGWCDHYSNNYALDDPNDQVTRIDVEVDEELHCWVLLAAWTEEKALCGVEFGLGDYDSDAWAMSAGDVFICGSDPQVIATSDPPWPQPNSGLAIAWPAAAAPSGNYIPICVMGAYTYTYETTIPIVENPATTPASPMFANCTVPPELVLAVGGTMGINTDGVPAFPGEPDPLRACCDDENNCHLLTQSECTDMGGTWLSDSTECHPYTCEPYRACCFGTVFVYCEVESEDWCAQQEASTWYPDIESCDPWPCDIVLYGACCIDQACYWWTEDECVAAGGDWYPDLPCEPNPCVFGACCFGPDCVEMYATDCVAQGGEFTGAGISCDPNPCVEPGACCFGFDCVVMSEAECINQAGVYLGDQSTCVDKPCTVACCAVDGSCLEMGYLDCVEADGIPHEEWVTCDVADCPIMIGACCYGERGLTCQILTERACAAVGGQWYPGVTEPSERICASPAPTDRASWSRIKTMYR